MEFWGVEVKPGQKLTVNPGSDTVLHLSQACLGEAKKGKGNESVPLFLKVDDQKLVIGTLSAEKCNHITYDLVFVKEFELSHNRANGSVYFCGYKSRIEESSSESESDSEDEEHIPLVFEENGIPEQKDVPSKPFTDNAKSKVKVVEPTKEEATDTDSDDDVDEDDSEDDSEDEDKSAEDMADSSDDEDNDADSSDDEDKVADSSDDEDKDDYSSDDYSSDDDSSSSDEEDEATPKAEQNKKRPAPPAESDTKTPTGKKAKLVTPQKIGGEGKKIGVHIATPYPSKQDGKTSANKDKSKQQTPASDGQVNCSSCSKSFKSDQARDSHSKAKRRSSK